LASESDLNRKKLLTDHLSSIHPSWYGGGRVLALGSLIISSNGALVEGFWFTYHPSIIGALVDVL
jgi:hypothetical protein